MALFSPLSNQSFSPINGLETYDNITRIATSTQGPGVVGISGLDFGATAQGALMNPMKAQTGSVVDANTPARIKVKIGPYKDGTHMKIREGTICFVYRPGEDMDEVFSIVPIWRLNQGCKERTIYEATKERVIQNIAGKRRMNGGYYEDTSAAMYPLTGGEFKRDWSMTGVFQNGQDPSNDPNDAYPIDYSAMYRLSAMNVLGRCQVPCWWGKVHNGQNVWLVASRATMLYDPGVDEKGRKMGGQVDLPSFTIFPFIPYGTEPPSIVNFIGQYERTFPTYISATDRVGNDKFNGQRHSAPDITMTIRDDYPVLIRFATVLSRKRIIPTRGDIERALFSDEAHDKLYSQSPIDIWLNGAQDNLGKRWA